MTSPSPAPLTDAERLAYVEIYAVKHNTELPLLRMREGASCEGCQAAARAVVAAVRPPIEDPYARTVAKLATALDNLGGRIYRDLAGDYAEIDTSGDVPGIVAGFNAFAEECLSVLNDPEVRAIVDAALSLPASKETPDA